MGNRRKLQNKLKELLKQYDSQVERAFLAAVRNRVNSVNLAALTAAIEANDFNRAVSIAGISLADLFPFDQSITNAYIAGGQTVAAAAPAFAVSFGFDGRATRAEAWARNHVGSLVTGIVNEQVDMLRETIGTQLASGTAPRKIAVQIVGPVVRGSREGGIVGLDRPRAERLRAVTEAIKTPEGVRSLVIKRHDGTIGMRYKVNKATELRIKRAYAAKEALSLSDQAISVRQYSNALLLDRGTTIARTESITALRAGRNEGIEQAIDAGAISKENLKRIWNATGDSRTRPDHMIMNGQEVDGMDTPFVLPDGSLMRYPGDSSLGASASQVINCRCFQEYRVDWLRG